MEAKVIRWGDDLGVRLAADEVERLGLREGQTVEITPRRKRLTSDEMFAETERLGPACAPEAVDWGPDRGSEIIDDADPR